MGILGRVAAGIAISAALSAQALAGNGHKAYVFALETGYEAGLPRREDRSDKARLRTRGEGLGRRRRGRRRRDSADEADHRGCGSKAGPTRWCVAASNMFGDRGSVAPGLIDFN
jgi:hypothetical protein